MRGISRRALIKSSLYGALRDLLGLRQEKRNLPNAFPHCQRAPWTRISRRLKRQVARELACISHRSGIGVPSGNGSSRATYSDEVIQRTRAARLCIARLVVSGEAGIGQRAWDGNERVSNPSSRNWQLIKNPIITAGQDDHSTLSPRNIGQKNEASDICMSRRLSTFRGQQ